MSNEKQQTAVEWLVDQLEKHYVLQDIKNTTAFLQAKEMEKERIEEAFINGHKDGWKFGKGETQHFFLSTIYYNETYGGE
jgi:hypothetical protein